MKRNLTSILTLLCALLALVLALLGLGLGHSKHMELQDTISVLQDQILQLQESMDANVAYVDDLPEVYCTLTVQSWFAEDQSLTAELFALACLPTDAAITQAQLSLRCGAQTQSRDIELLPGEADNCYDAYLPGAVFSLPAMESGDELTLELVISCTDGHQLTAQVDWYWEDNQLLLISG